MDNNFVEKVGNLLEQAHKSVRTAVNLSMVYTYEHAIIGTREENPVISGVSELVPFSF